MNTPMNTPIKTAVTAALAAAVLTLTACGTTAGPTSVVTSASSPMMSSGPHNQADITFAQQMTIHHRGAIAMADLAPTRAASSQVKTLAAAIKAAQDPEIGEMTGWLAAWAPSTDMNGMPNTTAAPSSATGGTGGMGGMAGMGDSTGASMPGMMTDQQMTALSSASGVAFDKMFLQLMVAHHQGALTMATTEKAEGSNPAALKLADSITTGQTAQISQMQTMLEGM